MGTDFIKAAGSDQGYRWEARQHHLCTYQADMTSTRKTTSRMARRMDKKAIMTTAPLLWDPGAPWNAWAAQASRKEVI